MFVDGNSYYSASIELRNFSTANRNLDLTVPKGMSNISATC
ncbi:hypothetical protein VITU9109_06395 [Vibrio tubiashii ATCC 19109]|uniref:Uncharacterized protein n=1 Tax=Vibrio tubiashii ATCC 19109 TaxID=1051646 RepID=A0ABN0DFY1_9VIBR|nr:hypothetical protein VITU9109_06395 [Vibrio tubiashii ATCC 19109]